MNIVPKSVRFHRNFTGIDLACACDVLNVCVCVRVCVNSQDSYVPERGVGNAVVDCKDFKQTKLAKNVGARCDVLCGGGGCILNFCSGPSWISWLNGFAFLSLFIWVVINQIFSLWTWLFLHPLTLGQFAFSWNTVNQFCSNPAPVVEMVKKRTHHIWLLSIWSPRWHEQ